MQITVAMKRQEGGFDAALIIDQKFTRSATGKSAADLFQKLAGALLVAQSAEAEELAINVGMLTKDEVERGDRQAKRKREIAEAQAEAEELEKLAAAKDREARAQQSLVSDTTPPVA